jgi:hypothetical protein
MVTALEPFFVLSRKALVCKDIDISATSRSMEEWVEKIIRLPGSMNTYGTSWHDSP